MLFLRPKHVEHYQVVLKPVPIQQSIIYKKIQKYLFIDKFYLNNFHRQPMCSLLITISGIHTRKMRICQSFIFFSKIILYSNCFIQRCFCFIFIRFNIECQLIRRLTKTFDTISKRTTSMNCFNYITKKKKRILS